MRCAELQEGKGQAKGGRVSAGKGALMEKCPTCSQPVSIEAETCPHCGHPFKTKGALPTWVVVFWLGWFGLFALLYLAAG